MFISSRWQHLFFNRSLGDTTICYSKFPKNILYTSLEVIRTTLLTQWMWCVVYSWLWTNTMRYQCVQENKPVCIHIFLNDKCASALQFSAWEQYMNAECMRFAPNAWVLVTLHCWGCENKCKNSKTIITKILLIFNYF